jgi:hypothetical protein
LLEAAFLLKDVGVFSELQNEFPGILNLYNYEKLAELFEPRDLKVIFKNSNVFDQKLDYAVLCRDWGQVQMWLDYGANPEHLGVNKIAELRVLNRQLYKTIIEEIDGNIVNLRTGDGENLLFRIVNQNTIYKLDEKEWLEDLNELLQLGCSVSNSLSTAQEYFFSSACRLFVKHIGRDTKNNWLHLAIVNNDGDKILQNLNECAELLFKPNDALEPPFETIFMHDRLHFLPLLADALNSRHRNLLNGKYQDLDMFDCDSKIYKELLYLKDVVNAPIWEVFQYYYFHINDVNAFPGFIQSVVDVGNTLNTRYDPHLTKELLEQIYFHILCGLNQKLNDEPAAIERIIQMLLNTKQEYHSNLLLALQTCSSIDRIENAINLHEKIQEGFPAPNLDDVNLEIQDDVLKDWLNYYGVFRCRSGLNLCHKVIKLKNDPTLILHALIALERIAIPRYSKALEEKQISKIMRIIQTTERYDIKNQACKTLWALCRDVRHEKIYNVFVSELEQLNSQYPLSTDQKKYSLVLLELLGNFTDHERNVEAINLLTIYLASKESDLAYQAALSLSTSNDKNSLLACLEVIKTHVWDRQKSNYGKDMNDVNGSFYMFRYRPDGLHDNQHAMEVKLVERLAQLESSEEFSAEIERRFEEFCVDKELNPDLQKFLAHYNQISKSNARFIGLPLYFPAGSVIGRGISSRKGEEMFFESVRDLIKKGCGSTDLTLESSKVDGQNWGRLGHVFGSHNSTLFDHNGTYFSGNNSAFMLISADFYNEEYLNGNARLEWEHTLNTVWYNGVPRKHIQVLFLDKSIEDDILLICGDKPVDDIAPYLISDIFKDQNIGDLKHLRRHLLYKDKVNIKGVIHRLSLYERIKFFDSTQSPALSFENLEIDGYKFSTEQEVLDESLKRAIGRQIIYEKYDNFENGGTSQSM